MMQNKTSDNNGGKHISAIYGNNYESHIDNLNCIANIKIVDLLNKNPNLLIFPASLNEYKDGVGDKCIFHFSENTSLTTNNIMGFIGCNETTLTIHSRFYKNSDDYFLHYMLQKVFAINLFDLKHGISRENLWEFLLYLFSYYLKRALNQGLFKQYVKKEYNDAKVKGTIQINRHIHTNIPFNGKIAYNTREFCYDNHITELIRHTIEYIRVHPVAYGILDNNAEIREVVRQIMSVTPSYSKGLRHNVISDNIRPLNHPFYTEYKILQKICLQILRREGLTYGKEQNKVYGILFDGAWLWEEYLNTVLKQEGWKHPENRKRAGGFQLFSDGTRIYPDFYKQGEHLSLVADAKYKRIGTSERKGPVNDYYQIITYMYRLRANKGYLLYPIIEKENMESEKIIIDTDGSVIEKGLLIPSGKENFKDFCCSMSNNEEVFKASFC